MQHSGQVDFDNLQKQQEFTLLFNICKGNQMKQTMQCHLLLKGNYSTFQSHMNST